jgi:hypothetical protein
MNHIFQSSAYTSLVLLDEQIRLVRLQPRVLSADIEIEFLRADLASTPLYEALSYEWGPTSDSKCAVWSDGKCLLVRENLWFALRSLRLESQPRTLWIDALCINQDDISERNHQVQQMGKIYEQSTRVIVWIGHLSTTDGDQDTATAVSFLHEIKANYSEYAYRPNQPWGPLVHLCYKTYWTRLWIIQEVVLATDILVQYGNYSFEWDILAGILDQLDIFLDHPTFLQEKGLYDVGQRIHASIPGRLNRQRIDRQSPESKQKSLLDLLWMYKEAGCVDPRDKVFALHGLAADCCRRAICIDYAKSTYEICGLLLQHHAFHHIDGTEFSPINNSRRLQTLLQVQVSFVLSPRSIRPIDYHYWPTENNLISLTVSVGGTISWISAFFDSWPPDDVLISSDSKKATAYQKMLDDIPQLRMIMSSLNCSHEYWGQVPRQTPAPFYQEQHHTGLTFSLPSSGSFATLGTITQNPPLRYSRSIRKVSDSLKVSIKSRASIVSDKWAEKDATSILRWWQWVRSPCSESERPRTRIFFCDNGLIGFAPGNADVGDVICRIEGEDIYVILRPSGLRHEVIGRLSIVKLGSEASSVAGPNPTNVQLHVDIPTLQLLCWSPV